MTEPPFRIEAMSQAHDRTGFDCGHELINIYFRERITQDIKRGYAKCFVAIEIRTGRLAGFYTLASNSIALLEIPEDLKKKMPRYPTVPVVLIGWMGRHVDFKGLGLGDALLFDAIKTIAEAPIASHAIIIDAIDDKAANFYREFGFRALSPAKPARMYITLGTALKAIADDA